jgi:signal transduction histidine kinase
MGNWAMDQVFLGQLRDCCRDDDAFRTMQHLLAQYSSAIAPTSPSSQASISCISQSQQDILFKVIHNIRSSLDIDTIFTSTATEVRAMLNADRVGVFQFYPDTGWNDGEFVSESVVPPYASAIAACIHDHCFGEHYASHYHQGQVYAVSDIYNANLSGCHIDILGKFQVKANLVVPLLRGNYLWGLLCIHQCSQPRDWTASEIYFVQNIAAHLGIAIQHAELLQTHQQQTKALEKTLDDLRHSQTQLIQHEKMSSLGQLVAGIAHEINNPVNFIYGNLSHARQYAQDLIELINLYQHTYPDSSPGIRDRIEEIDLEFLQIDFLSILRSMQMGADRIRQIVLSLRNFSRIDEADVKQVNIHEGLDSTLLILHHRLKANGSHQSIHIVRDYGEIPPVECLPSQLNQVFMNLLSNAIDALRSTPPKTPPQIVIATTQTDMMVAWDNSTMGSVPAVQITISDNGPGIPSEIQPLLFDPFFTTKPIGEGTGLGLAISYKIVTEHHHGTLICQSCVGSGATFQITVPLIQSKFPSAQI